MCIQRTNTQATQSWSVWINERFEAKTCTFSWHIYIYTYSRWIAPLSLQTLTVRQRSNRDVCCLLFMHGSLHKFRQPPFQREALDLEMRLSTVPFLTSHPKKKTNQTKSWCFNIYHSPLSLYTVETNKKQMDGSSSCWKISRVWFHHVVPGRCCRSHKSCALVRASLRKRSPRGEADINCIHSLPFFAHRCGCGSVMFFLVAPLKKGMGLGRTNGSGVHLNQKKVLKYMFWRSWCDKSFNLMYVDVGCLDLHTNVYWKM